MGDSDRSNPHPHRQIYAVNLAFKTIETEARASERHLAETGRILFKDILEAERDDGRRIIFENESVIVFPPYFAPEHCDAKRGGVAA
jgi:UDPglucose--hexose-1-phosphate uridylyltransferase